MFEEMDKIERNQPKNNPVPAPRLAACPSARFETEKYLVHTFFLPDIDRSPLLNERDVQIMTVQMGLLSLEKAPAPCLEDFAYAPSRDKPKRTGSNLNSSGHVKCPDCNKRFHSYVAMFSHIQIHQDKASNGFKSPSIKNPEQKPKPQLTAQPGQNKFLLRKLSGVWTVTKIQSPCEDPVRKTPEEEAASILVDMSKSRCNCQSEKNKMAESPQSEEDAQVTAILIHKPDLKRNCESKKRKMPISAQLEKKKPRKNALSRVSVELKGGEVKDDSNGKTHVCEICWKGFSTGPKLGGHMRKHYVKKPCDQK